MTEAFPPPPDDDRQFAELMRAADADAAPVDAEALQRLRSASTQAFETKSAERNASDQTAASGAPSDTHFLRPSGTTMKIIATLTAVVLVSVGLWVTNQPSQASPPPLGDVLAKLNDVDVLQLEVTRGGETASVWVRQPGLVRWEDSATRYRIARGSRLWRIDAADAAPTKDVNGNKEAEESAAQVVSEDNPWFGDDGRIDLIAMLNVQAKERESLLNAKPSRSATFAGKFCHVYEKAVAGDGEEPLQLSVFVDRETEQLVGMSASDPAAANRPPLAELTLIAMNPAVDDSKFRVPVKLAESDRIGKVTDSQGIVALRPVGARRWTPICRQLLVQPGDWIRTDVRGANAATIVLDSKVTLVVGPHSLVELVTPNEARLHFGTVQVARTKQTPNDFKLNGVNDGDSMTFSEPGKPLIRFDREEKLAVAKGKPVWLAGYEGTSAEDSIGSLIVKVDGREQSLSVGEHHVTVEIRDQIARTTIEETFVNHTNSRLEGQFHFPLPQDASISGFGMWINGELIEADIVEKQRAREIYETILREKRDPGLLEWTGGNIFKARVFPIEAHSEKRIKIVYTQVLPLRGNRFRYSYALKSEMLQTNPLKELNIRVLLNSAVPLAEATSTTHTCRTQQTKHSAELEFTAQEYTPTRDFEVVCEVDHRENDLIVIPHRRGDDGYFLMQLMPPGADGQWAREVIPDGDPLKVIVLCDTSGSMNSGMRKTQAEFVATLLTSLGDKDRFTLATTDVETQWVFDEFVSASDDHIKQVREHLDGRVSLGWTDLDQAFAGVMKVAEPGSQIIYVGDGIVSTIESDPSAFVNRLQRLNGNGADRNNPPTFHAVSVGSAYESVVLKGIASLGGGSMRQISGETTPQETALELLNEIAQPGLKNVNVEFRGVRVAAVYPERLPNIAAGTQQILVGRYLPTGEQQTGEVVVTGVRDGKPVKYVGKIELANAEAGNSFIPRLWARGRLDSLLQEGSTPLIQNEIIGLSEEFHIITPYTSLLVLETDADRERFGVKRRFQMRDGERFFADGRDNANYELRQKQMQRAGNWRLGLRRRLLARLVGLGRDANAFQARHPMPMKDARRKTEWFSRPALLGKKSIMLLGDGEAVDMPVMTWDTNGTLLKELGGAATQLFSNGEPSDEILRTNAPWGNVSYSGNGKGSKEGWDVVDKLKSVETQLKTGLSELNAEFAEWGERESLPAEQPALGFRQLALPSGEDDIDGLMFEGGKYFLGSQLEGKPAGLLGPSLSSYGEGGFFYQQQGQFGRGRGIYGRPNPYLPIQWVDTYFPSLAVAPGKKKQVKKESKWPAEALAISKSLLREAALRELPVGLEIERVTETYNSSFDRLTPAGQRFELWSPARWLTRDSGQGRQPIVNWLDKKERGVFSEAFLLGRRRKSLETEFDTLPLQVSDYSLSPLHQAYRNYRPIVGKQDDRVVLRCVYIHNEKSEVRFTIDTEKHVLVKQEVIEDGKVTSTTTHSQFIEVAGLWWAQRIETINAAHPKRVVSRVSQTVKSHDDENFRENYQAHKSLDTEVVFLTAPMPSVRQAKQADAAGTATAEDRFMLLLHFCVNQKWPEAFDELRAWETLVTAKKPGAAWVRIAVEKVARRNEEARQHLETQADAIVAATLPQAGFAPAWRGTDLYLATHTLSNLYNMLGWDPYGAVVRKLNPVFARQQDKAVAMHDWKTRWLQALDSLGRTEDALALHKEMLDDVPGDVHIRTRYSGRLNQRNLPDEALKFLKAELAKGDHWDASETNSLRFSYADILESRGRYAEVLAFYQDWLVDEKTQSNLFPRYLSALVMNDKVKDVEATVNAWLKLGEQEGKLNAADLGKVKTAVQFCFGRAHNISRYNGMDRKWLPVLYKTVKHCIARDDRPTVIQSIARNSYFSQSDEGDRLRGDVVAMLLAAAKKPAVKNDPTEAQPQPPLTLPIQYERLTHLLVITRGGRLLEGEGDEMRIRQVTKEEWTNIADAVLKWWETTPNESQKNQLSYQLTSIYSNALTDKHLPFLRRRVAEAPEGSVSSYRRELYNALLAQPWTAEIEDELFTLWPQLPATETYDETGKKVPVLDSVRTAELVPLLYRLVDTMLNKRVEAARQALQDQGNVDAKTRTERKKSAADILKEAREGLADRLQKEWKARGFNESQLPHWIMAEKMYLDMLLDRSKGGVWKWAWAQLGAAPPKFTPPVEKEGDAVGADDKPQPTPRQQQDAAATKRLNELLKQRAWVTAMNLASRANASDKQIDRVLAYIDAGIASGEEATKFVNGKLKEEGADEEDLVDFTIGWRRAKYNALILFDRPDELVTALKQWIARDKWNIPWRRALAKLYAERGELKEAIAQMESVKKDDELTPQDYAAIADWYLVVDQREAYERSRIETYKSMQEWQLNQLLSRKYQKLSQGQGPHELDETTLFIAQALFEKATTPSNYYGHLHNLYTATRDFRMLEMLPESMLGRTQQAVYSALSSLQSYLIKEVRNEATADEILKHVHRLRDKINEGWVPRGADPNARAKALDLRALDLLESMIERKASEVLNQPGVHGKAALVTFKRAFTQEWQEGERLQYAHFLQNSGAVTHERNNPLLTPLADEQLRQMRQLYDDSERASDQRVRIGLSHAQLLFNGYNRRKEALTILEAALNEFAAAHDSLVPYSHNSLVSIYSQMLQREKQYVKAEQYVERHLAALTKDGQRWTYVSHLNSLHLAAVTDTFGRTSLGSGTTLLDNLIARLTKQCDTNDDNRRYNVLYMIGTVFDSVIGTQDNNIPSARPKLLEFANKSLQEFLNSQKSNYSSIVQHFGRIIRNRVDALEAFSFLLDRFEVYPPRFDYGYQNAWQQHGWQLAQYRAESEGVTNPRGKRQDQRARHLALEKRLLPIVLAELRNDLTNLRSRHQAIYHNNHSYYWSAKAADFLKVAEDVLKDRNDSPRTILYVARYIYEGLDKYNQAIEVLFVAHRRGLLDDDGQLQLVLYLHERTRHAESIPLLEPIVERRPNEMRLRVLLIRAYYHGQRPAQLADFTAGTDAHFHKEGRWVENNVIAFARVLSETRQDKRAADVFEEAISLHQNSRPNRGIGSGLSAYYYELAQVYSRLGEDEKAVDAAAGAVVSWGNNQNNRKTALEQLKATIASVKDLPAFIKSLDRKAKRTEEDSPLLRKMTGAVLQQRREYAAAIEQYKISLELQPYDRDVHQWMIECFDKSDDTAGATQQLLALIDFDRHNLALYNSLAKRTKDNPELAERAATSIIEQAPNEAESHQALATFRQEQDRWSEAISLWKRVAELRKLEPTGLLGLAKAQLHEKQMDDAKATLNKLRRKSWPAHFGDVDQKVRELEKQLAL